jgi:hypothetical protein
MIRKVGSTIARACISGWQWTFGAYQETKDFIDVIRAEQRADAERRYRQQHETIIDTKDNGGVAHVEHLHTEEEGKR